MEILACATDLSGDGYWKRAQKFYQQVENDSSLIGVVARLNILIGQYHMGDTQLIPERAVALLPHLPITGWLPCAGLALLAGRKNGQLGKLKPLVLALSDPRFEPADLPNVPISVMIEQETSQCIVREKADTGAMRDVVQEYLESGDLAADERTEVESLAARYLQWASRLAART